MTSVTAGRHTSLVVTGKGRVFSWGENSAGQLGDGTVEKESEPQRVHGLSKAKMVDGGWKHSLSVTGVGTVYAWGSNDNGMLGDGTTRDRKNTGSCRMTCNSPV